MRFVGDGYGVGALSWGGGRSLLREKQMGNERYREKAAVSFNIQRAGLQGLLGNLFCGRAERVALKWGAGGGDACPARPLSLGPSHRLGGRPGLPGASGQAPLWGKKELGRH